MDLDLLNDMDTKSVVNIEVLSIYDLHSIEGFTDQKRSGDVRSSCLGGRRTFIGSFYPLTITFLK